MSGFTSINSLEPGTRHTTCTAPSICTMYDQWLLPVWDWGLNEMLRCDAL